MSKGLLDNEDLEEALAEQRRSGRLLGEILVDHGSLSAVSLARALAEQHGVNLQAAAGSETPRAPAEARSPGASEWRPLGRLLVEQGFVRSADLLDALAEQERRGRRLGEILVSRGLLSAPGLARALAAQHGVTVEEWQLEAGTDGVPPAAEPDLYEVREVFDGVPTSLGTILYRGTNFLEAADFAFEYIERHEPAGLDIELVRNGQRETVWSYSATRAAAEAASRKGLVDTFGFDPTRWGASPR